MTDSSALQEVEFQIAGKNWRARPTYAVLARVEYVMGSPCRELGARAYASALPLGQRGGIRELGIAEAVNILCAIFSGDAAFPKPDVLGERFVELGGYIDVMAPLGDFLVRATRGNKEYERELREKAEQAEKEAKAGDAAENPPEAPQEG